MTTQNTQSKAGARGGAAKKESAAKAADTEKGATTGLNNMLGMVAEGWRGYNLKQLDFVQKNTDAYFEMARSALSAKNLPEAMAIYNRFTVDAVSRQMEQARELGKVVTEAQQQVGKRLGSLLPKRPG